MSGDAANVELVRGIYGFDWIAVGSRESGFSRMQELVADDFCARLTPALGKRVVDLGGLRIFIEALEADFEEFTYEVEEITDSGDGTVLATGTISCRGRASKLPLRAPFSHVWTFGDGEVRSVVAHGDDETARRDAGL